MKKLKISTHSGIHTKNLIILVLSNDEILCAHFMLFYLDCKGREL